MLVVFFPLQVFDYDFGLQDDFMGSAYLYLESLEHQRSSNALWHNNASETQPQESQSQFIYFGIAAP